VPRRLEQADFSGIEDFVPHTKGTMLEFASRTTYYRVFSDEIAVGFCGVVWMKGAAKFKNDFVLPEHRDLGHFKWMVAERLKIAAERGVKKITACCTPMSFRHYVASGFAPVRRYKNGCTDVVRILSP
jgi:GNAT superfamily N-acetyltransferase